MPPTLLEPLGEQALRRATEEWLTACTIATEVPPAPTVRGGVAFTAEMIPLAIRAVAEVIANRVASPDFPDAPLAVVLQPKQFSGVLRGLTLPQLGHRDIWLDAVQGRWFPAHVGRCLHEWRRVGRAEARLAPGALYYYSPVSMIPPGRVPGWAAALTPVLVPGLATAFFSFFRPSSI